MTTTLRPNDALERALDKLVTRVEKPTRYIGGEWNSITKDPREVETSVLLAFPDLYEIGMSHLGYRILYAMLNELDGVAAERAFMPWVDMLGLLREEGLPLTSLETRRPLGAFDLVGFSMQSELTTTNVLAMLDLGGVPLVAEKRGEDDPIVMMGGPVIFNPEPFALFSDAILAGDAEVALPEAVATYRRMRREGAARLDILRAIARIEGWYVPRLYDAVPEPVLGMLIPRPKAGEDVPERVKRAIVYDLNQHPFPSKIVVPHAEIVHDRVSWEVMRGCPVGCRFCQAGYVYRPTRERDPAAVADGVKQSITETGYDEFSLSSLNTGEYGPVEPLMTSLMDELEPEMVSVGLGSLHASTMTETLAEQVKRVRKSGFTMAPEAGSERMRRVINKNLDEEQILRACRLAFEADWKTIKLYFMLGLPTETMEDAEAIVDLSAKILEMGREIGGGRVKITCSASTFIPKPFTPFQWFGMATAEDFHAKQDRIKELMPRGVQFKHHDRRESWLEGVLSRADRAIGPAILKAYEKGATLDAWSEHVKLDAWVQAFEECGLDAEELATRDIPLEAELPWEIIDTQLRRRWLEHEHKRALSEKTVVPCGAHACAGCAPFAKECIHGIVGEQKWTSYEPGDGVASARSTSEPTALCPSSPPQMPALRAASEASQGGESSDRDAAGGPTEPAPAPPVYAYRARFRKEGRSRFLGHLDLVRAIVQSFRRAGIPFVYTQGFKPKPKLTLTPALALGIASREEYADFETPVRLEPDEFLATINEKTPHGLTFEALVPIDSRGTSLQELIGRASYRAVIPEIDPAELRERVESFVASDRVEITRIRKKKEKRIDLRRAVAHLSVDEQGALAFTLAMDPSGSARPSEVLGALVGEERGKAADVERVALLASGRDRWLSPLVAR